MSQSGPLFYDTTPLCTPQVRPPGFGHDLPHFKTLTPEEQMAELKGDVTKISTEVRAAPPLEAGPVARRSRRDVG